MTRFSLLQKLLGCTAASAAALASVAQADIAINDNLAVSGYVGGSYKYMDFDPGTSADRFNLDAAKVLFNAKYAPATGTMSFYYAPGAPEHVTLLDAFATYDVGNGLSVTGGKFLSYMGYEAFDLVNMSQITYANGDFLAPIPGYHSGLRLDYASDTWGGGVALLDSVYTPGGLYLEGDGELKENQGFEAFISYKGIDKLTLWLGGAYESSSSLDDGEGGTLDTPSIWIVDLWASYNLSDTVTIAGEYVHKDGGFGSEGYNWLAFLSLKSSDTLSTAFRVSGEDLDNGPEFLRFTVAPSVALTPNLTVRAEATYTDYKNTSLDKQLFFGLQSFFKF